jgi:hypothetical protein
MAGNGDHAKFAEMYGCRKDEHSSQILARGEIGYLCSTNLLAIP